MSTCVQRQVFNLIVLLSPATYLSNREDLCPQQSKRCAHALQGCAECNATHSTATYMISCLVRIKLAQHPAVLN